MRHARLGAARYQRMPHRGMSWKGFVRGTGARGSAATPEGAQAAGREFPQLPPPGGRAGAAGRWEETDNKQ